MTTEKEIIEETKNKARKEATIESQLTFEEQEILIAYNEGLNNGINRKFDISIQEALQSQKQKIIEEIENLPNPYPLDIFPRIELKDFQTQQINDFLNINFKFGFDRLSAELMRRARENCKLDILKSLGEK